jgi:hypothetical protein
MAPIAGTSGATSASEHGPKRPVKFRNLEYGVAIENRRIPYKEVCPIEQTYTFG